MCSGLAPSPRCTRRRARAAERCTRFARVAHDSLRQRHDARHRVEQFLGAAAGGGHCPGRAGRLWRGVWRPGGVHRRPHPPRQDAARLRRRAAGCAAAHHSKRVTGYGQSGAVCFCNKNCASSSSGQHSAPSCNHRKDACSDARLWVDAGKLPGWDVDQSRPCLSQ